MEQTALEKQWAELPEKLPSLKDAYSEDGTLLVEKIDFSIIDRIPKPTGWRIVVLPFRGVGMSKGGIAIAKQVLEKQQLATTCGYVLAVGDLAYRDTAKFPNGAWCKPGDWIVFARYAGARMDIDGGEIRIMNDDEIMATVKSPDDILHM
jgi:co-chaperonin GroES (HSP10)